MELKSVGGVRARRLARRLALAPLRFFLRAVLKFVIACAFSLACAVLTMLWLGHPVPGLSELDRYFDSLEQLSKILS